MGTTTTFPACHALWNRPKGHAKNVLHRHITVHAIPCKSMRTCPRSIPCTKNLIATSGPHWAHLTFGELGTISFILQLGKAQDFLTPLPVSSILGGLIHLLLDPMVKVQPKWLSSHFHANQIVGTWYLMPAFKATPAWKTMPEDGAVMMMRMMMIMMRRRMDG